MSTLGKKIVLCACILSLALPVYARNCASENSEATIESPEQKPAEKPDKKALTALFLEFINRKAYAAVPNKEEEKEILRNKWHKLLNVDIFYPYFKAEEMRDWVSKKSKVEFFDMEGQAEIDEDQITYIFEKKF